MKVSLVIVTLALCGCVSPAITSLVSGIPSTWPKDWEAISPAAKGTCPSIAGTYENLGLVPNSNSAPIEDTLSYRLFGRTDGPGVTMRITQLPGDLIQFDVLKDASQIFTFTSSKNAGDFSCADGGVAFRPGTSKSGGPEGGLIIQNSTLLIPVVSGELAARVLVKSGGLAYWLIPGGGIQRYWMKFSRATHGA
jgi:hypothetical protein